MLLSRTTGVAPAVGHDDVHGHPHGWRRWLYATNHKDIGTLYLWFALTMFMTGGVLALLIRARAVPARACSSSSPSCYNQFVTLHGLIMVFGAIMPAFVGFANWMVPLQIGASDMAFARMNNFSFWLLPPAAVLLVGAFFTGGGAAGVRLDHVSAAVAANGRRAWTWPSSRCT